jgi:hypothetical protein
MPDKTLRTPPKARSSLSPSGSKTDTTPKGSEDGADSFHQLPAPSASSEDPISDNGVGLTGVGTFINLSDDPSVNPSVSFDPLFDFAESFRN